MVSRLMITLAIYMLWMGCCWAQSGGEWEYQGTLQMRSSVGQHVPLLGLGNRTVDRRLLNTVERSEFYVMPIALSYYFKERWGLDFSLSVIEVKPETKEPAKLFPVFSDEYYFLHQNYDIQSFTHIYQTVGMLYRYERQRYFVNARMTVGVLFLPSDSKQLTLKERNTNTYLQVEYKREGRPNVVMGTSLGTMAGYKIAKRFSIFAEVNCLWYPVSWKFTESQTNLYTEEVVRQTLTHRESQFGFQYGGGIMLTINTKRPQPRHHVE